MLKFDIFGKQIAVERNADRWVPYFFGTEGKRRRADFEIPDSITEAELCRYLADLFHESASASHPDALRVE